MAAFRSGEMRFIKCPHRPIRIYDGGDKYPDTRGNHDNAVGFNVDPRCTSRYTEMADTTLHYSQAKLESTAMEYLRDLPLTRMITRDNRTFYLCHAIPSDPLFGYCAQDSEVWTKELELVDADFLSVGHTHTPFIRKIAGKTIVNPGSLGQPKTGKSEACYAVWENGKFELKQFIYPVERAVQKIKHMPIPDDIKRDLTTVLQTGALERQQGESASPKIIRSCR